MSLSLLFATSAALAQAPAAPLAFEVATIKPSAPLDPAAIMAGKAHLGTKIDAARVDMGYSSLLALICTAYKVKPYQVTGPDWIKTTMFDIQAKIPQGGTPEQVPDMLQALLADRFGLKIHRDGKDQNIYALVVAKDGPRMKEAAPDPPPPAADAPKPAEKGGGNSLSIPTAQGDMKITRDVQGGGIEMSMPGSDGGKLRMTANGASGMHMESSKTTMKTVAEMLSNGLMDRPVVDMTGLTGNYEVALDISMEDIMNAARAMGLNMPGGMGGGGGNAGMPPTGGASDPSGSSIFASVQKLGLRLEPRKQPLDLIVVDHLEKIPSEN